MASRHLGVNQLVFNSGSGSNALQLTEGAARIDSTVDVGSVLSSTVSAGAQLTTARLNQNGLTLSGANTKVTILPDGALANVLESLTLDASSTLDLTNNDLILRATAGTKDAIHSDVQAKIASAQNGVDTNFITNWDGPGITSTSARTSNVATGFDLAAIGAIRNSDIDVITGLPGAAYPSFGGVPVSPDDVLVKYTYIGDGNLDGLVSFDDYVGMDNAFFGLIPNLGWATGDINFDNAINFDDYTVVDQAFFFQGAPLASVGEPQASAPGVLARGEGHRGEGSTAVGFIEESLGLHPTLPGSVAPAPVASSESEDYRIVGPALQAADSLSDARLSVTRRADSRDLWDDALLGLYAE